MEMMILVSKHVSISVVNLNNIDIIKKNIKKKIEWTQLTGVPTPKQNTITNNALSTPFPPKKHK